MNELDLLLKLIKQFEGCHLTPYFCPAGVLTCGWGATGQGVIYGQSWTQEQADERLRNDAIRFLMGAKLLIPNINGSTLSANADFAYNLGLGALRSSTLRKKLLAGDIEAAKFQIMRWDKAGGRVMRGLTRRRQAESNLFEVI
jgi:lysozyme